MKRILVKIEKLHEETIDAIQTDKDKKESKVILHNKAFPMREKPELSKQNDGEFGLPVLN